MVHELPVGVTINKSPKTKNTGYHGSENSYKWQLPPLSNTSFSVVLCDRVILTTVAVTLLSTTLG